MAGKIVLCSNCLQWFSWNPEKPWGIKVQKRGYSAAYYCGECFANTRISKRKEIAK